MQRWARARAPWIVGSWCIQGARASRIAIDDWCNQHDQHTVVCAADAAPTQTEEPRITYTGLGRVFAILLKACQYQRLTAAKFDFGRQVLGVVVGGLYAGAVAGEGGEGGFTAHAQGDHQQQVVLVDNPRK